MIRPLLPEDVPAAAQVQYRSFTDLDRRTGEPASPFDAGRAELRIEHFRTYDPAGGWVAEADGRVVGVALAGLRGDLWGLSLLAVDPAAQSGGHGRGLLAAALAGLPARRHVIVSSGDPRALRSYARTGFALHPTLYLRGIPRLDEPRPVHGLRPATAPDPAFLAAVDRAVRGAERGPDHGMLAVGAELLVTEEPGHRGYVYVSPGRGVSTVVAESPGSASALLAAGLARTTADCFLDLTAGQQWAVPVALAAGLRFTPGGALLYGGMPEPANYLPSGAYL